MRSSYARDSRRRRALPAGPRTAVALGGLLAGPGRAGRSLLRPSTPRPMLLEYWRGGGGGAPPWASIRTSRYQYTEYYAQDGSVSFREYYPAGDRFQLRILLHDGVPGNNPDVEALHERLLSARACQGSSC